LHLEAQIAWTEASAGGFEVDDGQRHNFVGGEIIGDSGSWV
jgi:hypothetical protein